MLKQTDRYILIYNVYASINVTKQQFNYETTDFFLVLIS